MLISCENADSRRVLICLLKTAMNHWLAELYIWDEFMPTIFNLYTKFLIKIRTQLKFSSHNSHTIHQWWTISHISCFSIWQYEMGRQSFDIKFPKQYKKTNFGISRLMARMSVQSHRSLTKRKLINWTQAQPVKIHRSTLNLVTEIVLISLWGIWITKGFAKYKFIGLIPSAVSNKYVPCMLDSCSACNPRFCHIGFCQFNRLMHANIG